MAREYARYLASTHQDADWAAMTTRQHDCFMAILSSPQLSWAGVVPYLPARYAGLASDLNERIVTKTWDELADHGLVVIDKRLGEVCVRSFLRHDNVLAKLNIAKAFVKAWENVMSPIVRHAISVELARIHATAPNLAGWRPIEEQLPELFDLVTTGTIQGEVA